MWRNPNIAWSSNHIFDKTCHEDAKYIINFILTQLLTIWRRSSILKYDIIHLFRCPSWVPWGSNLLSENISDCISKYLILWPGQGMLAVSYEAKLATKTTQNERYLLKNMILSGIEKFIRKGEGYYHYCWRAVWFDKYSTWWTSQNI